MSVGERPHQRRRDRENPSRLRRKLFFYHSLNCLPLVSLLCDIIFYLEHHFRRDNQMNYLRVELKDKPYYVNEACLRTISFKFYKLSSELMGERFIFGDARVTR